MKRDLEIIRRWLLYVEENGLPNNYIEVRLDEQDFEFFRTTDVGAITYNFQQAVLAGLITPSGKYEMYDDADGNPVFLIQRLSPSGHDYLDSIRNEGVWVKTKQAVADQGGNVALELVKSIAIAFGKKQIEDRTGLKL